MIDKTEIRYFVACPKQIPKKYHLVFCTEDLSPIGILNNSAVCYPRLNFGQTDDELWVLSVLIAPALEDELSGQIEIVDPMTAEHRAGTRQQLRSSGKIFSSLDDVRVAYPQTDGFFEIATVDENGVETVTRHEKMKEVNWAL